MSRWSRSLPVLAVVGAVSIVGCGGSDYPDKANDICKDISKQVKGIPRPKSAADFRMYFTRSQRIVSDALRRFTAIKPPSEKRPAYQAFVNGLSQEVAVLKRAANTVTRNPRRALTVAQQQSSRLSQTVNSQAKAAGLSKCASSGSSG